ncbi:Heparinase II/III-like protein [Tangfeifania diversioriginum]|uniref:Heparinase II/III-like protein n=1 Tax=Tangfeifania diversioriginum TaxID=1168035 RepID=A0A1M6FT63_9BACT|nr:heparinase II/III family protein [Tangfeifania diversioriginum]SHJ00891.1 Heparinase II/III-like protein [Tangfeifania diversioriginum]
MRKNIVSFWPIFILIFLAFSFQCSQAFSLSESGEEDIPKLNNPVTEQYLRKNLRKSQPRLVLNSKIESHLKKELRTNPVVQNMYKAIQLNAAEILDKPLLERVMTGRRLLSVSREMLYRMNMLGMVYRMEKEEEILQRINDEVIAVCNFADWNPSHFLDVAEMSLAVALALDWTAGNLPQSTIEMAQNALIEKGIKPSWLENGDTLWWVNGTNNWNQVCNGGMIAASIAVAEKAPELAAKTIHRSLNGIPFALAEYIPDGLYPEGSTYWGYGTSFSVITSAMLQSAFGTDFGIADYPAFKESATFRVLMNAPSGWYYNFADCGDKRSEKGDVALAWFAAQTGNKNYFERERFLIQPNKMGKLQRLGGAALVWISQFEKSTNEKLPTAWKGEGDNPVVVFRGDDDNPHQFYFGGKGGRATTSHGNMDAGSFIFELNGVRWVIDPGNQSYHELEKTGFNLWGSCQECDRWKLLTKNNFGHSTISVNNELFVNDGFAPLISFKKGQQPEAVFDLSAVYGENMKRVIRKFQKENSSSLIIEDNIETSDETEVIVWQLMTTANVQIQPGGIELSKNGKTLQVENLSHPDFDFSVVSLDPPPFELDRQMEGLKRIELRIPAWIVKGRKETIKVRLAGN